MNLVAYLRVSTDRQAEHGLGMEVQQEAIERWAAANRHTILEWHRDEGISGATSFDKRDGLAAALQAICEGTAEGIVFHKMDRLARSITEQEAALAHAWRCGGRVFAADHGEVLQDDPDDPMRMGYRLMVGVFSQIERAMIAKRLRDGRKFKGDRGGFAYGSPPFGYRADKGELVEVPEEQEVIAKIADLREQGQSLQAIADILNSRGVTTKRGGCWYARTVRDVIRRLPSKVA